MMRSGSTMACVGAAWAGLFGAVQQSHGQTVYYLPNLRVEDLTDDGTVAIGSTAFIGNRASMTWTAEGGVSRWGLDPTIPGTWNQGSTISGDGSTYFGYVEDGANKGMFRYRGPGTYQFIANPSPSYLSTFTHASRNGEAAIGYAYNINVPFPPHIAVRWTPQSGTVALGFGSESDANDISSDGSTIVGSGYSSGRGRAWIWTVSGGTRTLGDLPGTGGFSSGAYAITGDSTVITGFSGADGEAVVWRNGVVESLGRIDGYHFAKGRSISDDASIIVGDIQGNAPGSLMWTGFVWTRDHGMETTMSFFARLGVTLPPHYDEANNWRVTADGRTLYVPGLDACIVRIPGPASALLLSALVPLSARRRQP